MLNLDHIRLRDKMMFTQLIPDREKDLCSVSINCISPLVSCINCKFNWRVNPITTELCKELLEDYTLDKFKELIGIAHVLGD